MNRCKKYIQIAGGKKRRCKKCPSNKSGTNKDYCHCHQPVHYGMGKTDQPPRRVRPTRIVRTQPAATRPPRPAYGIRGSPCNSRLPPCNTGLFCKDGRCREFTPTDLTRPFAHVVFDKDSNGAYNYDFGSAEKLNGYLQNAICLYSKVVELTNLIKSATTELRDDIVIHVGGYYQSVNSTLADQKIDFIPNNSKLVVLEVLPEQVAESEMFGTYKNFRALYGRNGNVINETHSGSYYCPFPTMKQRPYGSKVPEDSKCTYTMSEFTSTTKKDLTVKNYVEYVGEQETGEGIRLYKYKSVDPTVKDIFFVTSFNKALQDLVVQCKHKGLKLYIVNDAVISETKKGQGTSNSSTNNHFAVLCQVFNLFKTKPFKDTLFMVENYYTGDRYLESWAWDFIERKFKNYVAPMSDNEIEQFFALLQQGPQSSQQQRKKQKSNRTLKRNNKPINNLVNKN